MKDGSSLHFSYHKSTVLTDNAYLASPLEPATGSWEQTSTSVPRSFYTRLFPYIAMVAREAFELSSSRKFVSQSKLLPDEKGQHPLRLLSPY